MAAASPALMASAVAVVTAMLYAYIGARLSRRRVVGDGRLAWTLFTHWWYGLAAVTLLGPVRSTVMPALGIHDPALHLTLFYASLLALVYILWALLFYLVYLFTGKRALIVPISVFYVGYYVFLLYLVATGAPRYDPAAGRVVYARPLGGPPLAIAVVLLVGPHIVGALGYFQLFFKTREPTQRYRIGLIAWAFIAWFGSALVGQIPLGAGRLSGLPWWPLGVQLLGLVAALVILVAYIPPRWVRTSYGIRAVDENVTEVRAGHTPQGR